MVTFNCAKLTSQVQDATALTLEDRWSTESLGSLFQGWDQSPNSFQLIKITPRMQGQ